ncbi:apiosidase-like domain-containing protein [Dyadobacter tibetensis]|uniref:apiosidase-like domain-containing protein n=1 Tax=Dyadobacter tibetensis TaxID=1211851 RepID=UPI000472C1A8|nr:DUF4038 domain-containing protein [Dyadobacter tibetensis]
MKTKKLCGLILGILFHVFQNTLAQTAFPLQASKDGQHLLDEQEQPFLMVADVAWQLFRKLSLQEAAEYMDIRKSQSFNCIIVQALPGSPNLKNFYKQEAFKGGSFSQPNPGYFSHIEKVVAAAKKREIAVGIVVNRQGWHQSFVDASPESIGQYMSHLIQTVGKHKNVFWLVDDTDQSRPYASLLTEQIRTLQPNRMMGLLLQQYPKISKEVNGGPYDLDFIIPDSTNSETDYKNFVKKQQASEETGEIQRPFLLANSIFSKELLDQSAEIRQQAFTAFMASGSGFCHQSTIKNFNPTWKTNITQDGAEYIEKLVKVLNGVPWAFLKTEWNSSLLVSPMDRAEVHVKMLTNKRMAIAYLPDSRSINVYLSHLEGDQFRAVWYSPRTGKRWFAGTLPNQPEASLTPPENKSEWDWILLIGAGQN